MGGLKKMLMRDPSEDNIKISMLSRSAIEINLDNEDP